MPIFFVISGLCFKDSISFVNMIKRKSRSLLFPYFFYATILYLIWTSIYFFIDKGSIVPPLQFISAILYDNADNSPYKCVQWFFTALFVSNILFFAIHRITKGNRIVLLITAIVSGLISYFLSLLPFRLPLSIDIAFMSCFFMAIGFLIREVDLHWYMIPISLLISVASFILNKDTIWNMRRLDYGNPLLYMVGSVSLSVMVIVICKYLSKLPCNKLISSMCFLGRNSIWILIYNQFFIQLIALIIKRYSLSVPNVIIIVLVIILMIPTIQIENIVSNGNKSHSKSRV